MGHPPVPVHEIEQMRQLAADGKTLDEIAAVMRITYTTAASRARRHKITVRDERSRSGEIARTLAPAEAIRLREREARIYRGLGPRHLHEDDLEESEHR